MPNIVVWIQGRASGSGHRSVIRELIANKYLWPEGIGVVTLFFVGKHSNSSVQKMLEYEYEQFGDIVQNNYVDNYRNQTAKMMSAMNFLVDYCPMSQIALRLDDDVMVHPTRMIHRVISMLQERGNITNHGEHKSHLTTVSPTTVCNGSNSCTTPHQTNNISLNNILPNRIICRVLKDRPIMRGTRRRYRLSSQILPKRVTYPDFCAGFFIAFTTDLLPKFRSLFEVEEPFWIDDSYLGVLQERIKTDNIDAAELLVIFPQRAHLDDLSSTLDSLLAVHLAKDKFYSNIGQRLAIDTLST